MALVLLPVLDIICAARLSLALHLSTITEGRGKPMNATLRQTVKRLLFAGVALMVLVAGSANWPRT